MVLFAAVGLVAAESLEGGDMWSVWRCDLELVRNMIGCQRLPFVAAAASGCLGVYNLTG